MSFIYFDNNATTPVHSEVLAAMLPYFDIKYGNAASSTHKMGWQASAAVDIARNEVAQAIGAEPAEIVFTSGATEAINMAIQGAYKAYKSKGNHVVVCKTEHNAVLQTCSFLEESGANVTYINVGRNGIINMEELEKSVSAKTILVMVMLANNETGVLQPIEAIAHIAHKHKALMMCDTTQAIGKMRCHVKELKIDIACISAHKFYGPKGIGALYICRKDPRVTIQPIIFGGGHENNLRPGTSNVPGIVGLGKAISLATANLWDYGALTSRMRTIFEQALTLDDMATINGSTRERLPNTTNLCFHKLKAQELIKRLDNVAMATGSACTSALMQPSHVLKAMGLSDEEAERSLRFSFGSQNTMEEVMAVIAEIKKVHISMA